MKCCLSFFVLVLAGMSSVASAQLATRCAEDNLSIDVSPGRNAWAANCGYISPIARDYFDSEGIYIVFTTGCGFAWCSPYVPISTASPCVSGLVEIGLCAAGAPPPPPPPPDPCDEIVLANCEGPMCEEFLRCILPFPEVDVP